MAAATAIAVNLAVLVASFEQAWLAWVEQHFAADLMVGGGGRVRLMAGPPIARDVAETIGRVPGVSTVEPFRVVKIRLGDRPVFLQGVSLLHRLAHGGLPMVEGELTSAAAALDAGTGVLLTDNLAYRLGVHRGDMLTVPTPDGPHRMRVEGTFLDFMGSLDLGAVAVPTAQLASRWHDTQANLLRVWIAPGEAADLVRTRVAAAVGPGGYYVLTGREFVLAVRDALDRFFVAAWAMIAVSALVGVVGMVNAQVAAVLDRAPELTTLRMVGVSPRTLVRSIFVECGVLGLLGGLLGLGLGVMLGAQMTGYGLRAFVGWRLPLVLPGASMLLGVLFAAVLFLVLAAWVPARAGARLGADAGRLD